MDSRMKRYPKIVLLGFSLWLISFTVSVLVFPLRMSQRPLFESIMPVVIVIWTVFFSIIYSPARIFPSKTAAISEKA